MIHTNELVAAVLFSVGATLAGTELFCRFTAKYSDKWYVLALAYGIPVALLIIGVYFQFFVKPLKTVPTTLIPQPKPAPPAHDVWKKMNNTRWVDSDGNLLFMQESLTLLGTGDPSTPVATGMLNNTQLRGVDANGTDYLIGTFSSDFTKFTFALTPSDESGVSTILKADPDYFQWNQCTQNQWSWTSNVDTELYAFYRSWVLSDGTDEGDDSSNTTPSGGMFVEGQLLGKRFKGVTAFNGVTADFDGKFSDDLKTFTLNKTVYTFQGYQY